MSMNLIVLACLVLAILSALVGSILLAFSDFLMRGLALARPAGGIEAMQGINQTVMRSVFLAAFIVLLPAVYALAAYALFNLSGMTQALIFAGAMIYLVTVFLVTAFGNVPMNKRLAGYDPQDLDGQAYWQHYLVRWTGLNHWRAAGALATSACFAIAAWMLA
tara:strand:+ start:6080 stop:6568 length:489 start_codon:yes stop_codon:yes gene_type:complete